MEAIHDRADADGHIVLAMCDEATVDMAFNFHEASLRRHHIEKFLFVTIGLDTCARLARNSMPCFHYADDPRARRSSSFGDRDFKRKMIVRTNVILEATEANFTVIYSDIDVAFLGNPISEFKVGSLLLHIFE